MPPPMSPITRTSDSTSPHEARRLATGRSSDVWWLKVRLVVKPNAPAFIEALSSAAITSRSASLPASSKARSPMAQVRRAEWPT